MTGLMPHGDIFPEMHCAPCYPIHVRLKTERGEFRSGKGSQGPVLAPIFRAVDTAPALQAQNKFVVLCGNQAIVQHQQNKGDQIVSTVQMGTWGRELGPVCVAHQIYNCKLLANMMTAHLSVVRLSRSMHRRKYPSRAMSRSSTSRDAPSFCGRQGGAFEPWGQLE